MYAGLSRDPSRVRSRMLLACFSHTSRMRSLFRATPSTRASYSRSVDPSVVLLSSPPSCPPPPCPPTMPLFPPSSGAPYPSFLSFHQSYFPPPVLPNATRPPTQSFHATPFHATPRHAIPRHATPHDSARAPGRVGASHRAATGGAAGRARGGAPNRRHAAPPREGARRLRRERREGRREQRSERGGEGARGRGGEGASGEGARERRTAMPERGAATRLAAGVDLTRSLALLLPSCASAACFP